MSEAPNRTQVLFQTVVRCSPSNDQRLSRNMLSRSPKALAEPCGRHAFSSRPINCHLAQNQLQTQPISEQLCPAMKLAEGRTWKWMVRVLRKGHGNRRSATTAISAAEHFRADLVDRDISALLMYPLLHPLLFAERSVRRTWYRMLRFTPTALICLRCPSTIGATR